MPRMENTAYENAMELSKQELARRLVEEMKRCDELYAEVVKWKQAYEDARNLATTAIALAKEKEHD